MSDGEIVGIGKTATVYKWKEGKVLKLFYHGYPQCAVEKEFTNAKAISDLDFAKPKVYELVFYIGRMGIIYDKVEGESLLDWVTKTGDIQRCATYMADLHKNIIQNRVSNVPNYKELLEHNIVNALSINPQKRKEILEMLDRLQDGNTLCHGDFHPGNIIISAGHTVVIDFMNVCHGYCLYDIARTVYLVEYTPVPEEAENKEMLLQF